jgi:hypothetical protein
MDFMTNEEYDRRVEDAKQYIDRLIEVVEYLSGPTKQPQRRRSYQDGLAATMGLAGLFAGAHERAQLLEAALHHACRYIDDHDDRRIDGKGPEWHIDQWRDKFTTRALEDLGSRR